MYKLTLIIYKAGIISTYSNVLINNMYTIRIINHKSLRGTVEYLHVQYRFNNNNDTTVYYIAIIIYYWINLKSYMQSTCECNSSEYVSICACACACACACTCTCTCACYIQRHTNIRYRASVITIQNDTARFLCFGSPPNNMNPRILIPSSDTGKS